MIEMKVRLTFTEEILGTLSNKENIFREYIASKAPNAQTIEEEVEAIGVDKKVEMNSTVFPKTDDGQPFIYDYQIKGFFKNAAKTFNYLGGDEKLTSYKGKIDNLVFVKERKSILQLPEGARIGNCERPLRGSTPMGEITALANSETCPAGTVVEFTILTLHNSLKKNIIKWLNYGALNGIGQWHNSGKGRFSWELLDEKSDKTSNDEA